MSFARQGAVGFSRGECFGVYRVFGLSQCVHRSFIGGMNDSSCLFKGLIRVLRAVESDWGMLED